MSVEDLVEFLQNKKNKALDAAHARILLQVIKSGDAGKMNYLIDRVAGKVKQDIGLDLSGTVNLHKYCVDYIQSLEEAKKPEGGQDAKEKKANEV